MEGMQHRIPECTGLGVYSIQGVTRGLAIDFQLRDAYKYALLHAFMRDLGCMNHDIQSVMPVHPHAQ